MAKNGRCRSGRHSTILGEWSPATRGPPPGLPVPNGNQMLPQITRPAPGTSTPAQDQTPFQISGPPLGSCLRLESWRNREVSQEFQSFSRLRHIPYRLAPGIETNPTINEEHAFEANNSSATAARQSGTDMIAQTGAPGNCTAMSSTGNLRASNRLDPTAAEFKYEEQILRTLQMQEMYLVCRVCTHRLGPTPPNSRDTVGPSTSPDIPNNQTVCVHCTGGLHSRPSPPDTSGYSIETDEMLIMRLQIQRQEEVDELLFSDDEDGAIPVIYRPRKRR